MTKKKKKYGLRSLYIMMFMIIFVFSNCSVKENKQNKVLKLWYDEPAPDNNDGWADRSIPLGNGYMGVNIFGGTATERIQITENSLYTSEKGGGLRHGGLNNFAEVYIHFNHNDVTNYERDLNLNEGISHVKYEQNGVEYSREYFTSYPDKVMVVHLSASKAGELTFTLQPTIPFLNEGKSGHVVANGNTITLSGIMHHYNIKYEGRFKVIPKGGTIKASEDGKITVSNAEQALIIIAVGTNYKIDSKVFLTESASEKLNGFPDPHLKVTKYINDAASKSYKKLLANHKADYKMLYDRVNFDLGATEPTIPTDELVDSYPEGSASRYLEELAFQFGRYMLICSSRKGTLPPHLQGIWNVYEEAPWAAQYLHDTNVQMAYAPVFSTNLSELFESYVDYFNAFVARQYLYATQYIKQYNTSQLDPNGNNGWSGPFWANPYNVPGKSCVAGFGTGSWISLMFWNYFDYTRDKSLLANKIYPVIYEQANFASRFVQNNDGCLLANPSSTPEQKIRDTIGTTFDQQMFYENHYNTIKAAKILGRSDSLLATFKAQLPLLDPIQIGKSGHIKEFRQEKYYGEMGDPYHRHSSMLLGLFPGQLINSTTPAWLDAAEVSLTNRTHKVNIGWSRAERIAMWARIHNSKEAYAYYKELLDNNYMHNMFSDLRGDYLFQADANYGATAGVAEMLMQSQDYIITPLPAIPEEWSEGSYNGLLARGNFEVSAQWTDGHAKQFGIRSKSGGTLNFRYPNVAKGIIKTKKGKNVNFEAKSSNLISIETEKGQIYVISDIPVTKVVTAPSNLKIENNVEGKEVKLTWSTSSDAAEYKLYRALGNAPHYELVASNVKDTCFTYKTEAMNDPVQITFKVTAVLDDGRESEKGATGILLLP